MALATGQVLLLLAVGREISRRCADLGRAATIAVSLVAVLVLATVAFWLLAGVGVFRGWAVVLMQFAVWLGLRHCNRTRELAPTSPAGSSASLDGLRWWWLVVPALVLSVRAMRALLAPCVGWDGLTYHFFRAGDWVQSGRWSVPVGPDVWESYGAYPVVGDAWWAWALVALRADALVAVVEVALLAAAGVGLFTAARALGASSAIALGAAASVLCFPAAVTQLGTAYVDVAVLATFALGFACLATARVPTPEVPTAGASSARGRPRAVLLVAAVAAFSLMVGLKPTTGPIALVAGAVVVWSVWGRPPAGRARLLAAIVVVALVGAPGYVRNWIEHGSPLFPFSTGEQRMEAPGLASNQVAPAEAVALLLWKPTREGAFTAPGLGALLVIGLGVAGVARRRFAREDLVLYAAIASAVAMVALPEAQPFRETIKVATVGRYLLPGFAALALLATRLGPRALGPLWLAANIGALQSWPRGWVAAELWPLLGLAGLVVGLGVLGWFLVRIRARRAVVALVVVGLGLGGLVALRDQVRYPLWQAAARQQDPFYLMHRIHPVYANAWGLWQALDDGTPRTLAVVYGWDGLGHNAYLAPWLGRRLQNRVVMVPVTRDGTVVGERDPSRREATASYEAWLDRLRREGVEVVVSLAPRTSLEDRWMAADPVTFQLVGRDQPDFHRVYLLAEQRGEMGR